MTESLLPLRRPRLLDLFCGAGGAAMGYAKAGFEVVGVDIEPQPNYPFEFIQQGATDYLTTTLAYGFDAIHASPPCQAFTAYRRKGHGVGDGYPNLIDSIRRSLNDLVVPYVIENVEQARDWLRDPVMLCGSFFGLDVRRHRLFETNWPLIQPPCRHFEQKAKGKRFPGATNRDGRYTCEVGVYRIPLPIQKRAMGVNWAVSLPELSQMVPPAYTAFIGWQMRACFETQWRREQERAA